jgi:hypothetical protein
MSRWEAGAMDKKVETLKAHPAAEAFRMHSDNELTRLVESIRAHGLRDLITIGVIGNERWIADGRNRLKACEIAGVPPRYEEIEFADEDELRAFVADRNERRDITSGERAMGHAMLFRNREKGGRGKKLSGRPDSLSQSHWKDLVSNARTVLDYSEELGRRVRDGFPLSEAFEQAKREREAAQTDEGRKARLRQKAPDLLTLVEEGRMTIVEADAASTAREKEAHAEELRRRENHLRAMFETMAGLLWWKPESIAEVEALMEDEEFAREAKRRLSGTATYQAKFGGASERFIALIAKAFPHD